MFCPQCGEKVGDESKYCTKCGYNLQNRQTPKDNNLDAHDSKNRNDEVFNNKDGANSKVIYEESVFSRISKYKIILFIISLVIIWSLFFRTDMDSAYISCAKTIIYKQLKSPATARWSNEKVLEKDDYGRAIVYLTVDAQNGFGAYIRENYVVVILSYDRRTGEFTYNKASVQQITDSDENLDSFIIDFAKKYTNWNQPLK